MVTKRRHNQMEKKERRHNQYVKDGDGRELIKAFEERNNAETMDQQARLRCVNMFCESLREAA